MEPHLAHITEINGGRLEQTVAEHSFHVADYATEKLRGIDLRNTAYLAGPLHDIGECTAKYQEYLSRAPAGEEMVRGSASHTFCGCIYLLRKYHAGRPQGMGTITCETPVYAIEAHHGQFDCVTPQNTSGFEYRLEEDPKEIGYEEVVSVFLSECASTERIDRLLLPMQQEVPTLLETFRACFRENWTQVSFSTGLAAHVILSAMIDGSRRDTTELMTGALQEYRSGPNRFWAEQVVYFEQKNSCLRAQTPINITRSGLSEQCRMPAQQHGGSTYRLTLLTGVGKTLSALYYMLYHAKAFRKERILFVIPLLNILGQNSVVVRNYIQGKGSLAEYHLNAVKLFDAEEKLDQYEPLTDTRELPVVITTLVQLLNTLFLSKASTVCRMNALSQAVIVISEVQLLPKKAMNPFTTALNFPAYGRGTTVMLSSAATLCFKQTDFPLQYADLVEIAPYEPNNPEVLERTEIINKTSPYGMSVEELAGFSAEIFNRVSPLLLVCNTEEDMLRLYRELEHRCGDCRTFHLSTSMCMAHRANTLKKINAVLESKEKVVCASTQLVETDVDSSFESVIRTAAGIDNTVQAVGHCNRGNDFGGIRPVHVVNFNQEAEKLGMLWETAAAQRCALQLLHRSVQSPGRHAHDLLSGEGVAEYYQFLFQDVDIRDKFGFPQRLPGGTTEDLFDLLAVNLRHIRQPEFRGKHFLNQAFLTAGNSLQVLDEDVTNVIVPYGMEVRELIADLFSQQSTYGLAFLKRYTEKAEPYTIQIFRYQIQKLSDCGILSLTYDDRFTIPNEWCYDNKTGLITGNSIYQGGNSSAA